MAEVMTSTPSAAVASENTGIEHTTHIPIAQLTPLLAAPASRSIKAVVTLTWPYSSVTGSVAFLLAEPDFRLRRIRGQVRVQFAGSSAKVISRAGVASGDEVVLCLDGVKFVHDQATTVSTPGRSVEFELRFTEWLVLEFRPEGSQETKKINIDHPPPEPEIVPARLPTPESSLSPLPPQTSNSRRDTAPILIGEEWSSPAFIKRARTSYGSLFDSDFDPFAEEDGSVRGKGRKRTRLSASWRYNSRSPTPDSEDQVMEQVEDPIPTKSRPTMTDEACQTMGLEEGNAAEALAIFSRQATNVSSSSYPINDVVPAEQLQDTQRINSPVLPALPLIHRTSREKLQPEIAEAEEVPRSSSIEHIPSDSLPLVSPVLEFKSGSALSTELVDGVRTEYHQDQSSQSQPAVAEIGLVQVEESEDLYTASPMHRREEPHTQDLPEFQAPSADNAAEVPQYAGHYPAEDQYGHWQSVNAQLSASNSPCVSTERLSEDLYDEEQPQEVQYHDGSPAYQDEAQYPALEDRLQDNGSSNWGFPHTEVRYPEIPQTFGSREHTAQPPRQAVSMSRSQSANSEQIDLTEDSDDDEPPQPRLEIPSEDETEEEYDEEEQEEYEDYSDELEPANIRLPQHGQASEFDEEESSPRGGSYDEDELEEEFEEEDEQEGETFSDMEDEMPRATAPPEVIDLLSSDDEEEPTAPAAQSSRLPQAHPHSQFQQQSEGEDEDDQPGSRSLIHSDSEHEDPAGLPEDESDVDENDQQDDEESGKEVDVSHDDGSESDQENSVTAPLEALLDRVSKLASVIQTPSRARPFPVTRNFSMDGASDAPKVKFSELPKNIASENTTQEVGSDTEMVTLESQAQKHGNLQLPTPVDTQLSVKITQVEQSFTSTISEAVTELEQVFESEVQMEVELSERLLLPRNDSVNSEIADAEPAIASTNVTKPNLTTVLEHGLTESGPKVEDSGQDALASPSLSEVYHSPAKANVEWEPEGTLQLLAEDLGIKTSPPLMLNNLEQVQAPETLNVLKASSNEQSHSVFSKGLVDLQPGLVEQNVEVAGDVLEPSLEHISPQKTDDYEATHDEVMLIPTTPAKYTATGAKSTPTELKSDSPRRSARRPKPTSNTIIQKEDLRPTTPNMAARNISETSPGLKERASPLVALDTQTTPEGHDASIELALAAAHSPIKHDLRKPPVADLKLQLSRALRTDLSKFTPLKLLRYNMNKKIDVLAVATTSPPEPHRAKGGPRHYSITFNITDPSIAPSGVAEVQIFRPYKDALPTVEVGEGILLRNFLVVPVHKGSFALRSTQDEGSAWAVFKDGQDPEMRGPPVELGIAEKGHVVALKAWYDSLDAVSVAKISRANGEKAASSGTPSKRIAKA